MSDLERVSRSIKLRFLHFPLARWLFLLILGQNILPCFHSWLIWTSHPRVLGRPFFPLPDNCPYTDGAVQILVRNWMDCHNERFTQLFHMQHYYISVKRPINNQDMRENTYQSETDTPQFHLQIVAITAGDEYDSKTVNLAADSSPSFFRLLPDPPIPPPPTLLFPHIHLTCSPLLQWIPVWISITFSSFLLVCATLIPPLETRVSISRNPLTSNTPLGPLTLLSQR